MVQRTWVVLGTVVVALSLGAIGMAGWRLIRVRTPLPRAEPLPSPPKVAEIEVTRTQITFGGKKLLELDSLEAQVERGVAPEWKERSSEAERIYARTFGIIPLIHALKAARNGALGKEIAIQLAPDVPYRVLLDVIYSSNDGGYESQRLSTTPSLELVATAAKPEQLGAISVFIRSDGFAVYAFQAPARNVARECSATGRGLAVDGNTNFKALAACLRAVRKAYPTTPASVLTAIPGTPAWHVLSVGNVMRCGEPSCPKTWLGPDLYDGLSFGVAR